MKSLRFRRSKDRLTGLLLACSLWLILPLLLPFGQVTATFGAYIDIDANAAFKGYINPLVFGQNVYFVDNNMWDYTKESLYTIITDPTDPNYWKYSHDPKDDVKGKIEALAPTILRFPGGSAANLYLWEDGLGFPTTNAVNNGSDMFFDCKPQFDGRPTFWDLENKQGLLLDSTYNSWSLVNPKGADCFTFADDDMNANKLSNSSSTVNNVK